MSGGYTKKEIITNIRKTKSLEGLYDIAYAKKGQVHKYAREEAKAEVKRRLLHKRIRKKIGMSSEIPSIKTLMRM